LLYRFGMTRAFLVGFVLLTAACGNKTFESLCAAQVPPPAGCDTACNPTAASTCPMGYHCSPDGKCDLFCTLTGGECGDGYSCTADGNCVKNGDGSGSGEPDASCPALHFTPNGVIPTVELLLDQSGSMNANYGPNNTRPTRWEALRTALIDPTNGVVTKLAGQVVFGAALYSNKSHDEGGIQVGNPPCPTLTKRPRAINNLAPIQNLLQANPDEDTPTGESIDAIVADFAANPPANNSPKIIVLATDGLPDTCADADPPQTNPVDPRQLATNAVSVAAAQRAFAAGIKLFFLFIGNDQAGNHPQEMANAGVGLDPTTGRAPFYVATNPTELTQAFSTIVGGIVSCDLRLDSQLDPKDAPSGTVTIDNRVLMFGTEWTLDNDGITIHILGNACTMLKNSTHPVVDAAFPCGTIIL
jgi:hypothetical protein